MVTKKRGRGVMRRVTYKKTVGFPLVWWRSCRLAVNCRVDNM